MVSSRWGGLAARAAMLASSGLVHERADQATYKTNIVAAINTLQTWYDSTSGQWSLSTGWWNSANCLTVLADFAAIDSNDASTLNIPGVMSTTFSNAQRSALVAQKAFAANGMVHTTYSVPSLDERDELSKRGFGGFLNDYYDDEGWWALSLLRSYDVNRDPGFLDMAQHIFEDMKNGTDTVCGGGIWWSKARGYKNAIANELYLAVAAGLANRVPAQKAYYLDIAVKQWTWFKNSGMINGQSNINDGLNIGADGSCTNNGKTAWSYNQGVVLGGLVELAKATGDASYISQAETIATAAIALLSDGNGVIHDKGCEPSCGGDGNQFKGIFVRNLGYLYGLSPRDGYKEAILRSADSIWNADRNTANNQLGVVWSGPYSVGGGPTAATQSSALDALVAALKVA